MYLYLKNSIGNAGSAMSQKTAILHSMDFLKLWQLGGLRNYQMGLKILDILYEWFSVSSNDFQSPALMTTSGLKVISDFASLKYFSKNKDSKYNLKYLDWRKKKKNKPRGNLL